MSVWGKLLGGGAGLMLGGPLGAVLGLVVGHGVDKIRKTEATLIDKESKSSNSSQFSSDDKQLAFATGVIVLSAKLAKADGKVSKEEIETFKSVFDFDNKDEETIGEIYNNAKKNSDGYEIYAKQLKIVFGRQEPLYIEFINALYQIAYSDGSLHINEKNMIEEIAKIFEMPKRIVDSIHSGYINSNNDFINIEEDYAVFSCNSNTSDTDLKKAYFKLVKDYHPDNLVSKGLPEEFIRFANERLSKINAAYERIKKSRRK